MYSNKKKEVKKFVAGGFLLPAIAQGALGLGQAIFGGDQRRKAKDRIEELRKNAPQITIPTAIRKLADEPIAEEFMEAQELGGQRRTATAIDALGRGGSRSLALLPKVLEGERIGEQQRAGQYEQARKGALSDLGAAQERVRDLKVGQYQNEMDAARQSKEAGQTNIFGGLGQIGRGAAYLDKDYISNLLGLSPDDEVMQKSGGYTPSGDTMGGVREADQFQIDPITGLPRTFEKGGMMKPPMKTKGEFDHDTNKKALVDEETGEKEAELSGDEVVFNKDDHEQIEMLIKEGKADELLKFMKATFAKFKEDAENEAEEEEEYEDD